MARPWRDVDVARDLWRHLVVTGAWWDVVDETASHLVGDVLARHRPRRPRPSSAWATDEDLWLRRTAVIAQLGHRDDTDLDLLVRALEANLDDRSFWLRKAIGWALRDYARTDPDWVRAYVASAGDRLSGCPARGDQAPVDPVEPGTWSLMPPGTRLSYARSRGLAAVNGFSPVPSSRAARYLGFHSVAGCREPGRGPLR